MIETIKELALRAGEIIRGAEREELHIHNKSGASDFVTAYDLAVQNFLITELSRAFPGAEFMGEEKENAAVGDGPTFIIDPIDGTTNFIRGTRHSCVSIGYYEKGAAVHGVVYNPYHDELFFATKGKGAYMTRAGKTRPVVRQDVPLSDTLSVIGTSPYDKEQYGEETTRIFRELLYRTLDLRRSGSAALDLCYVADGRYDLFFEQSLSPWDFAAGRLLVEEAGGVVSTPRGEELPLAPSPLLAGAKTAHAEFIREIGFFG